MLLHYHTLYCTKGELRNKMYFDVTKSCFVLNFKVTILHFEIPQQIPFPYIEKKILDMQSQ